MLELLTVIEKKGRHICHGKIKIGFNNKKGYDKIVKKIYKLNTYAQEAGAKITMIKWVLRKIKFKVEISIEKGHRKQIELYCSHPLKHLIKECDRNAREMQENTHSKEHKTNIKFYGSYSLMHNGNIASRTIQELVRIIDAK